MNERDVLLATIEQWEREHSPRPTTKRRPGHTTLTPAQRTLRARIAAHALHAQGGTNTKAATAAFLGRWDWVVDPDLALPPDERARRAQHALRAHMASLSLKASRARARRSAASG